jgi:hypothetical protein
MAKKKSPAKRPAKSAKSKGKASGLPKLKWDDGEWIADVVLPAWKGFLSRLGAYNSTNSSRKSTGKARLRVLTADDARVDPTVEQQRAWQELVANQEAVRDAMLRAIVKEYSRFRKENADELDDPMMAEVYGDLPKRISKEDELRKLIGLSSVYIHPAAKGGVAYVGYGFGCEWEDEHGLGVMTHRRRVLGAGHEDVAFMADVYEDQRPVERKWATKLAKEERGFKSPDALDPKRFNDAVIEGNLPWVEALLTAGASPEKRHGSPVHFNAIETAAIHGHTAILRLLLQHAKKPVSIQLVRMWVEQNAAIKKILVAHGVKEE